MALEARNLNDLKDQFITTVDGIDFLATGKTDLFTPPTGKSFITTALTIRLTSVTGSPVAGSFKLIDDTAAVDIIGTTALTTLTTQDNYITIPVPVNALNNVPAGNVIKFEITTAYTVATVVTGSVDLVGYLV
jgi:hypothetical protein